jgi:hypothetical protein
MIERRTFALTRWRCDLVDASPEGAIRIDHAVLTSCRRLRVADDMRK